MSRGRHTHRAAPQPRGRRLVRLVGHATVLTLLATGTTAFAAGHKTVALEVDGASREVSGFARTVGDVLAEAGVELGPYDEVIPAADAAVVSGGQVVVRHARQVSVELDGATTQVWTTAETAGEAVDQLGLRGGALLSVSRSTPLGRAGLRVSTEKTVHVVVDGQVIDGVSTAATVRDALREVGLVLGEGDQVSVPLDAAAVNGLVVLVSRAATAGETVVEATPFATREVEDPALPAGTQVVVTRGKAGLRTTTYQTSVVGGVVVERTPVTSVVTTEAVEQVVKVGTGPAVSVQVDPGSAQAIGKELAAARGWGDDEFACLLQLWNRESGWRIDAANSSSGAYGIPQALPGSKMASVADDWRTNPVTQITWGLGYVAGRYSTPCGAWSHFLAKGWY